MNYTITRNEEFNSLEITFDAKPSAAIREALKSLRFRWHSVKQCWYGYTTEDAARAAIDGKPTEDKPAKPEAFNKFGVKVGDLFYSSWGYEQTNVDFFQVVALVGACSVRVRQVSPKMIDEIGVSGMSSHRRYEIPTELLPGHSSVFVKDTENGDLKRLVGDPSGPAHFRISSYANAYPYYGQELYESWYY